jgi:hypothetical protein
VRLRLFLFVLGGFGAAAIAVLLSSGTAHAETPKLPVDPAPVLAPVRAAPEVVEAVVDEGFRTLPSQPSELPIVQTVVEPVLDAAPIPLPAVSDILPLGVPEPAKTATAAPSTDRVRLDPQRSTASRPRVPSRVRADAGARARPVNAAVLSVSAARAAASAPSTVLVVPFGTRDGPPGVSAGGQAQASGGVPAASIESDAHGADARWSRLDFASGRAPRAGIAFDLSPPG